MAIQSLTDLKALINSTIQDNTTNDISGSDVQTALINAIDTLDSLEGFINVHKANGQTTITAYGSKALARAAVPDDCKKEGVVIAYKISTGWLIEQNLDATAGTWGDDASWQTIGPVSVSQNTITLEEWQPNTDYVVGNQRQYDGRYYSCSTTHTSSESFDETKWREITDFVTGGVNIQKINIGTNEIPIFMNCIKITGMGTGSVAANANNVGDVWYYTTNHVLRVLTEMPVRVNKTLPFYDGAIYTCNNRIYLWNGSELEEINREELDRLNESFYNSYFKHIESGIIWESSKFAYNDNGKIAVAVSPSYKLGKIDVSALPTPYMKVRSIIGYVSATAIVAFADNDDNIIGTPIQTYESEPVISDLLVPSNAKYLYLSYLNDSDYPIYLGLLSDITPVIEQFEKSLNSFSNLSIVWQNNKFAEGYKSVGDTLTIADWTGDIYRLGEVDLTQLVGKKIQINCISDTNYNASVNSYIVDADNKILVIDLYMNEGTPIRSLVVPEGASKLVLSNRYSQYPNAWVYNVVYADCEQMQTDINALKPQVAQNTADIADIFEELGSLVGDGAQWHNKKWYAYGTSITETDNQYHTGKYAPFLQSMSQMLLTNKGIGGGGITNYGAYSTGQVKTAIMNTSDGKTEADIITFEVGANDVPSDDALLGDIYDTTDSTFCGCLNQCIRYLLENTSAQIVVMPSVVTKTDPANSNFYKMIELIKRVCLLNRVYFLDGSCGLGWARIKNDTTYTVDTIHQSELGGYILAKYMWSKIKDIPTWDLSVPN